jgi:hypothetical protein
MSAALATAIDQLRTEAQRLTGDLPELAKRATVYRHLFLASGGNHAFPVIAAHGALWAGSYFRWGLKLGELLSWHYFGDPRRQAEQLLKLARFADVFRDINRRVCIDTYVNFHFTRRYGDHPDAAKFIPPELLAPLQRLHAAVAAGRSLTNAEKQDIYTAHFVHEQTHIVGPTLSAAVAAFDWPLVRAIALQPPVRFAYFPRGTWLWFHNFAAQEERIDKGLAAFQIAARVGWSQVDAALARYRVLPTAYFAEPATYFQDYRQSILGAW